MKRFILKLLFFFSLPLCYLGINSAVNYYFIRSHQSIPIQHKKVLIAGDSGPQKGINPKYFSSAENIAQLAEPSILTFWKLKRIFRTHLPDTLILGLGPYGISKFQDFKFSTDDWSGEIFKRSYLIANFGAIDHKIPVDYSGFYKAVIKQVAFYPQRNHVKFIGSYSNKTSSDISNWKAAIKRHYYFNNEERGHSELAISYLDSIENLCNSKQISLVLVSPPLHKNYVKHIPERIWDAYTSLLESYKERHLVIDATKDHYPDSLFLDANHLNALGATRFTKDIVEKLKKEN